jgi:nicotinamide-nucleotide amidase
MEGSLSEKVQQIHTNLQRQSATLAVAESLTGGELCAALTSVAGASQVIRGGLVVYATDLKSSLAGVDSELLATRGAVDPAVAAQLAIGARDRLRATFGVGLTGVAGPDEQDGRPVGEVHCAVAGPGSRSDDLTTLAAASLPGRALPGRASPGGQGNTPARQDVRQAAVVEAIDLVLRTLREWPSAAIG